MPPSFSVIVPTYGRPEYLRAAVDSVLAQTVDDLECIVVDDATPIPVPRPSQDPRVRLVSRARNGGPAAARNSGLQAATGTYVAFLDDDDVWVPDRLEQALDQHRRAPLVVCFQSVVGGSLDARGRQLEGDVADSILDSITPHLGATTCARDDLLRFDETYRACEDVEWWLRIAQHARVAT
ncbi:MAG TPA: glycosyltransferase family 2 protein, partial [Acidimicrobiia bacterium]|nr:glycosyltransferase family 2 protein [Acidimicrobiia bacterium]